MTRFRTGRAAQQRAELAAAKRRRQKSNTWFVIIGLLTFFAVITVINVVIEINQRQTPDDQPSKDSTNQLQSGSTPRH